MPYMIRRGREFVRIRKGVVTVVLDDALSGEQVVRALAWKHQKRGDHLPEPCGGQAEQNH
jgi:hypothetical protein